MISFTLFRKDQGVDGAEKNVERCDPVGIAFDRMMF